MTSLASSTTPGSPQARRPHAGSVHGVFWTRLMLAMMRVLPDRVCELLCYPGSFLFYLVAGEQRRALIHNARALSPHLDDWSAWWTGWSVFYQFALVYLDRLFHMHFEREIQWDLPDLAVLEQLRAEQGGVLIFTAHSGNYDIGASLFASKLGRPVHIVRVPEAREDLQRLREQELTRNSKLHVHYNDGADAHLGLQLCRLLQDGEFVAVQGDRVVRSVAVFSWQHEGVRFDLPHGPLVLAAVNRCPCYSIFLSRTGFLRYRIHASPPFAQRGEALSADEAACRWLGCLVPFISQYFDQWFVFEPMLHAC